jgi:hypothetical protein
MPSTVTEAASGLTVLETLRWWWALHPRAALS